MSDSTPRACDESPIMRRLLEAIADSENDHPGEAGEKFYVDFSRKDAMDAVARIVELRSALSAHKACVEELAAARARLALFDQMREALKHVLADLKSPFPKEAQAIARLRMGESSIEKAEAILAALKALENKTGE